MRTHGIEITQAHDAPSRIGFSHVVQDLLDLGNESRMNLPGSSKGNWDWRMEAGALDEKIAGRLKELTVMYNR